MRDAIVDTPTGVTLIGGGSVRRSDLLEALEHAPCLVAADGGAENSLRHNLVPEAVIGDLDSLGDDLRARLPADSIHRVREQETTDFDKVLRSVRAPFLLGVGFLGRRLDHQLANLNVLVRRSGQACILIGKHDVAFAVPKAVGLTLPPGTRLSLFPFRAVTGRSQGLEWPIDNLRLAPDGRVGTSNNVDRSGKVLLEFESPGMLVILPRSTLAAAISGLRDAQAAVPGR